MRTRKSFPLSLGVCGFFLSVKFATYRTYSLCSQEENCQIWYKKFRVHCYLPGVRQLFCLEVDTLGLSLLSLRCHLHSGEPVHGSISFHQPEKQLLKKNFKFLNYYKIMELLGLSQPKNIGKRRARTSGNLELSQTSSGNLSKNLHDMIASGIAPLFILCEFSNEIIRSL